MRANLPRSLPSYTGPRIYKFIHVRVLVTWDRTAGIWQWERIQISVKLASLCVASTMSGGAVFFRYWPHDPVRDAMAGCLNAKLFTLELLQAFFATGGTHHVPYAFQPSYLYCNCNIV